MYQNNQQASSPSKSSKSLSNYVKFKTERSRSIDTPEQSNLEKRLSLVRKIYKEFKTKDDLISNTTTNNKHKTLNLKKQLENLQQQHQQSKLIQYLTNKLNSSKKSSQNININNNKSNNDSTKLRKKISLNCSINYTYGKRINSNKAMFVSCSLNENQQAWILFVSNSNYIKMNKLQLYRTLSLPQVCIKRKHINT